MGDRSNLLSQRSCCSILIRSTSCWLPQWWAFDNSFTEFRCSPSIPGMVGESFLLLFGLTDETFVINYSLKVPTGYDKTTVQVWVTLLDYFYWVLGAFLGGFLGSTLNLQIKGLDFVMTALFIVLALEQFMQEKSHISSLSGVVITIVCLLLFGKTYFLVATLLLLVGEYYFLYRRHQKAGEWSWVYCNKS